MRDNFNKQLEELNRELIAMGTLCEDAISGAGRCLLEDDPELITVVFDLEKQIDQQERDIEALCMRLLMQQQPVARDLRNISAALKMISDMERIGDQAQDIAEIFKFVKRQELPGTARILDMANAASNMVTAAIDSFVTRNLEAVRAVIDYDDVVDRLFLQVKEELTQLIRDDPKNGEAFLDVLMIAKYLERIADHATNIAEWVEFSITGQHPHA